MIQDSASQQNTSKIDVKAIFPDETTWFDTTGASEYLCQNGRETSKAMVYQLSYEGKIIGIQERGRWAWPKAALDAYIAAPRLPRGAAAVKAHRETITLDEAIEAIELPTDPSIKEDRQEESSIPLPIAPQAKTPTRQNMDTAVMAINAAIDSATRQQRQKNRKLRMVLQNAIALLQRALDADELADDETDE